MNGITCPSCGKAKLEETTVPRKEVLFEGVKFQVQDAKILECPNCGNESYPAAELRRWQELKCARLIDANQIPNAGAIKKQREHRSFSVSDFAALMGVTRQTQYSWEDEAKGQVKFGPASLLLRLLMEEGALSDEVFAKLLDFAHERGQLTEAEHPLIQPCAVSNEQSSALRRTRPVAKSFWGQAAAA